MQLTQRASDSNHPRTTKQNQTGTLILPSELILFEMRPNAILWMEFRFCTVTLDQSYVFVPFVLDFTASAKIYKKESSLE